MAPRAASEEGSAGINAVFGVAIFLSFVLLTVQVLLHLYASSAMSAAAFDGARGLASEDARSCAEVQDSARSLLGQYGREDGVTFPICVDRTQAGDEVVFSVRGPSPAPLVSGFFGSAFGLGDIEREARVRVEEFRAG